MKKKKKEKKREKKWYDFEGCFWKLQSLKNRRQTKGCCPTGFLSMWPWHAQIEDLKQPIIRYAYPSEKQSTKKFIALFIGHRIGLISGQVHQLDHFFHDHR